MIISQIFQLCIVLVCSAHADYHLIYHFFSEILHDHLIYVRCSCAEQDLLALPLLDYLTES